MRKIEIGKVYKHFKGNHYVVLDIVNDSESNDKMVIYIALYGERKKWARTYSMFNSLVDHKKYPDVKQKYRFEEFEVNAESR